jgi:hypothetical protein
MTEPMRFTEDTLFLACTLPAMIAGTPVTNDEFREFVEATGYVFGDRTEARGLSRRAGALICRFVTHDGNARSFPLCSLENMIMAAAKAYAGFALGTTANALFGSRHASLYPPSRPRTTLHNLPKLCGPGDVRQGGRT